MRAAVLVLLAGAFVAGVSALGNCDPLTPEVCLYPFPNDFYTEADATTETGLRLRFTPEMMPRDVRNETFDPSHWNTLDGFSVLPSIMTFLGNVSLDNVPGHRNLAASLEDDCPTVLINAETGERVLHFAELDFSTLDAADRAFLIAPAYTLQHSGRYIVALRSLRNEDGNLIEASEAFAALRDGTPSDDADVNDRRDHFEDIFGILESNGISRASLQQAWDFTVASQHNIAHRQLDVVDDAIERIGSAGPDYRIYSVDDEFNSNHFRRIIGLMTVPLYMDSPLPNSQLVLDENDVPVFQGFTEVKFTVLIPRSIVNAPGTKGAVVQYGHGLLGGQGEVEGGYLGEMANKFNYIFVACDWQGMSSEDYPAIIRMMATDIGTFNIIPERLTQGILNSILLMNLITNKFATDDSVMFNGTSVIDTTQRYYFGNSQGGIFGHNYLAFSPWVDRGCLGVPGAPYNMLLARSVDFTPFFSIIKARYPSNFEQTFLIGLMGMLWDRSEPVGALSGMGENPFPGRNKKYAIFHYGIGDAQVSWLGALNSMRSVNAAIFENSVTEEGETLVGFDVVSGSVANRSVGVGFKYHGVPPAPVENTPPLKEYDTHGLPRRDARANQQMNDFFKTGIVYDYCDGVGCYDDFA